MRGIPDLNPKATTGQATLFDTWRFPRLLHHQPPERLDTVAADNTHRGHAIIEQVHADLKNSTLAHLPSGKFSANPAHAELAAAMADALRGRGIPDPAASLAAETGLAVFKVAFARWISEPDQLDLPKTFRAAMSELRHTFAELPHRTRPAIR